MLTPCWAADVLMSVVTHGVASPWVNSFSAGHHSATRASVQSSLHLSPKLNLLSRATYVKRNGLFHKGFSDLENRECRLSTIIYRRSKC
jgi:hypothetical protein